VISFLVDNPLRVTRKMSSVVMAPVNAVKRAWFVFCMWTGLISAEGLEFYLSAPLVVLLFIGLPMAMVYRIVSALVDFIQSL